MEFRELTNKMLTLNVNEMTEERDGLTYLSWASAWVEVLKLDERATFEVVMFRNPVTGVALPYTGDPEIGYMVFTEMNIGGVRRECHLPVMDSKNRAMKTEPYEYKTKTGTKTVEAMTMFDVNKAIMRCLAKNISLYGLGAYIYKGEDLPEAIEEPCTPEQVAQMKSLNVKIEGIMKKFKVNSFEELTKAQAQYVIEAKQKAVSNEN